MSSAEINYLTASEALELFRSKKLSPVEYLRAIIAQCERVNPKVNAFTYTFFDRALEQAKAAEARYAKGDGVRPLEGIPVVIKDLHPVEDEITTCGSRVLEGVKATYTAPAVQRLFDGAYYHPRIRACGLHLQRALGSHAESMESRLRSRGIFGRRRRGRGGWNDAFGRWY
jgi:aspartyl-tRNA(Asn)/glutamyl-tRNA(Gln) amidotransferase subunit A